MNRDNQLQYYIKIMSALNQIFNDDEGDGSSFIGVKNLENEEKLKDFLYVLSVHVPQEIVRKITGQDNDPVEHLGLCIKLLIEKQKEL